MGDGNNCERTGIDLDIEHGGEPSAFFCGRRLGLVSEGRPDVSQRDIVDVEDEDGMTASDTVSIVVQGPNEAPICTLISPQDGSVFMQGDLVTLAASVTDINQSSDTLDVHWSSSIDGDLFSGNSDSAGLSTLDVSDLSLGSHLITFEATDEGALSCAANLTLVVGSAPTVSITAPNDGAVVTLGDVTGFSVWSLTATTIQSG